VQDNRLSSPSPLTDWRNRSRKAHRCWTPPVPLGFISPPCATTRAWYLLEPAVFVLQYHPVL